MVIYAEIVVILLGIKTEEAGDRLQGCWPCSITRSGWSLQWVGPVGENSLSCTSTLCVLFSPCVIFPWENYTKSLSERPSMIMPLPFPNLPFWLYPNFAHSTLMTTSSLLFSNIPMLVVPCLRILHWPLCLFPDLFLQSTPSPKSSLWLNFSLSEQALLVNLCELTSSFTLVPYPLYLS